MYYCPMHPEVRQQTPGKCSICGMALVGDNQSENQTSSITNTEESYWPLVVVIGLISLSTAALSLQAWMTGRFSWEQAMQAFMAGFFLVFAGFKLLDLPGFADGYATYDLLAKRWHGYGYVYPFLELLLGLAYLTGFMPMVTNLVTVILLGFSGLGVAQKLLKRERFQCACLGTFLKVPLTKVTLVEDFGMAAMAVIMLLV
jgi:hypothetical protein